MSSEERKEAKDGDEDSGSEGRATPTGGGAEGGDRGGAGESALFSWPSGGAYDENRQLLGTEEESSDRQSSDEEVRTYMMKLITMMRLIIIMRLIMITVL